MTLLIAYKYAVGAIEVISQHSGYAHIEIDVAALTEAAVGDLRSAGCTSVDHKARRWLWFFEMLGLDGAAEEVARHYNEEL